MECNVKMGFDLDGVVADSFAQMRKVIKERYGIDVPYEPRTFELESSYPLSPEQIWDAVIASHGDWEYIEPITGALEFIEDYYYWSNEEPLVIITSRGESELGPQTYAWCDKYLPPYKLYFTDGQPKSTLCFKEKVTLFVEDRKKYASELASIGITTILLDREYNKGLNDPFIIRAKKWKDVYGILFVINDGITAESEILKTFVPC